MRDRTELNRLHNPYDFANPVSKTALFSGRRRELDEIAYYLDEATKAPRPMNLAILGARASGKTSLLNMIDVRAREKGLCVARIDLNEGDVQSQLGFFGKMFDSVFSAVCDYQRKTPLGGEPFGGKKGRTYDAYLDMVSAYQVPDNKEWCPFLFPIQYAKAMSARAIDARVSDHNLRQDLVVLRSEVSVPIAILIDECNVLADQRILLEKLRNLFMNTPGYMLVFTGTPDLFPVMDEVFSPIVRQFKKIVVGAFEEPGDVTDCIRKPLEEVGLSMHEAMEPETLSDLTERRLTAGRPYEIQLLCHFMFRRMQQGRTPRMRLDLDVLEDVLAELERDQALADRRTARAIRTLPSPLIDALQALGWCSEPLRFDELWFVEYVPDGTTGCEREELRNHLASLVDLGVLVLRDERVVFAGDELELLYCKYYARRANVTLELAHLPPDVGLAVSLDSPLERWGLRLVGAGRREFGAAPAGETSIGTLLDGISAADPLTDSEIRDPRLSVLYRFFLDLNEGGRDSAQVLEILVRSSWISAWILLADHTGRPLQREHAEGALAEMSARASELGGELSASWGVATASKLESLRDRIAVHASERTRREFAAEHVSRLINAYTESRNVELAAFHALSALVFGRDVSPGGRNNAAYVLLQRNPAAAEAALLSALEDFSEEGEHALPYYNLGVIAAQRGDLTLAIGYFDKAAALSALKEEPGRKDCVFLYVPRTEGGVLRFEEVPDVCLKTAAEEAGHTLRLHLQ